MNPNLLITGATGHVGTVVVEHLIACGHRPRVLARRPSVPEQRWGNAVDVVAGNFTNPESLRAAMREISRVLLISADGPDKVGHELAVVDAAVATGIEHLVKLSAQHADADSPLPCFAWHGRIEQYLAGSGLPHTNLRPAFFMENLLMVAPGVAATGQLFAPTAGQATAMIAIEDVAACAATALTQERPGASHLLTGPDAVTFTEVAAAIARATARPVGYVDLTPEAAQPRFEADKPRWLADHLSGVFELIRTRRFTEVTQDVPALLGRPARSIDVFAQRYAAFFAPAPGGASRSSAAP